MKITKKPKIAYALGAKFKNISLTAREGDCMYQLLNYKTIKKTGVELNLSLRTVEAYLKNVKAKLQCDSKNEVLTVLSQTDFLKNYENRS